MGITAAFAAEYEPFTDEELKVLWSKCEDQVVKMILVMCYSGFRVSAYVQKDFEVNLEEGYFKGYSVREADRKRMMGHSFGNDITNGVYGHRTLEELRTEIEKIKVPEAQPAVDDS